MTHTTLGLWAFFQLHSWAASIAGQAATPARETPSLQQVKSNVSGNFQQDDLDVPAFIRKRGEN